MRKATNLEAFEQGKFGKHKINELSFQHLPPDMSLTWEWIIIPWHKEYNLKTIIKKINK